MEKAEFYREARTDLTGPLAGVRVLEATTSWAGPMAACVLADLGADVVKCELPGGEMSRHVPPRTPGSELAFLNQAVNRNKRSLTLDLRTDAGRDLFLRLAARSDVVVQNFLPGTLDRWGVGYEHCRAVKPDIVYVSVSGFGQFGPWSSRAGYDPTAQAVSGWMSLNGPPEGDPVKAPSYLCDDLAGLHGAIGALAALRHRDQTGEGQHVDAALLDSVLFQSNGFLTLAAMGEGPQRMGSEVNVSCPTNLYRCAEGHLFVAVALDAHWQNLCKVMNRTELSEAPGFATNAERVANRDGVNEAVGGWAATVSAQQAFELLSEAGIACAPVQSFEQAARTAHVLERDMLQDTVLEDGVVAPLTGPVAKFSRTPTRVRHAAPALGAHNRDVLHELGVEDAQIAQLHAEGVI
ncbi:MAG: CaiB/BaiF CoA transferase family protein [Acidimicrobiales bacterium]